MNKDPFLFKDLCIKLFKKFENNLNGEKQQFLHDLRKKAIEYFTTLEFPSIKNEEWKYSNISFLNKVALDISQNREDFSFGHFSQFLFDDLEHSLISFVNGIYNKNLSKLLNLPEGLEILNLSQAVKENHPIVKKYLGNVSNYSENFFTSLNTSFIYDGVLIYIPDGKILEEAIHIILYQNSLNSKIIIQPRNLIIIGKNAQATIIEHYLSDTDFEYLTNSVTEIVIEENGYLNHIKLQEESLNSTHIGRMDVKQGANSHFKSHLVSTGAKFSRNEFNIKFDGEGSESTLNGLFMIEGEQLFDAHTLIDHAKPKCNSYEHYKGILSGNAKGVFNGKVFVRPDAQKTNAFQENNTILLSDTAVMNSKPQLEIFADDVKCSHGATIGKLNQDAKFYLKSRGIGEDAANAILIHAFASEVISSIKIESLKDYVEKIITKKYN